MRKIKSNNKSNENRSDKKKEKIIQSLAELMRNNPVTIEDQVKKNPKGIKVIQEVSQEQLNSMLRKAEEKEMAESQNRN